MKKEQVISIVRHIISVLGGVLLAYGIGQEALFANISGVVLGLISLVWSIRDKSATISQAAGIIRQVLTFVGGFLIVKGVLTPEKLEAAIGAIVALLPVVLGQFDKIPSVPSEEEQK